MDRHKLIALTSFCMPTLISIAAALHLGPKISETYFYISIGLWVVVLAPFYRDAFPKVRLTGSELVRAIMLTSFMAAIMVYTYSLEDMRLRILNVGLVATASFLFFRLVYLTGNHN